MKTQKSSSEATLPHIKASAWVGLFACLGMTGCAQPWNDPAPDEFLESFLLEVYTGDFTSAYEKIAADDRARLVGALEAFEGGVPAEVIEDRSRRLVVGGVDSPYDLKRIGYEGALEEKPKEGSRVLLRLTFQDGREGTAEVVWEGGSWHVDLPDAAPAAPGRDKEEGGADGERP